MGTHWLLLTVCGFLLAGFVGFFTWWAYRRLSVSMSRHYYRHAPRSSGTPRSYSPTQRTRRLIPSFFQRKKDIESGASDSVYELVPRDD